MSPRDENNRDPLPALTELITAFSGPHAVHPALVEHVLAQVPDLLRAAQEKHARPARPRMPTLMWPRSVVFDVADPPPVPPAAL
jgi:hypothetical protein